MRLVSLSSSSVKGPLMHSCLLQRTEGKRQRFAVHKSWQSDHQGSILLGDDRGVHTLTS